MLPDVSAEDASHTSVTELGVDADCENVIVSPTEQFGNVTRYDPPGVGVLGDTVAPDVPPATVVVAPATVVVVVPPATVVVVVLPATVVVVVVVESATVVDVEVVVSATVSTAYVKLFGPAPSDAVILTGTVQYFSFCTTVPSDFVQAIPIQ